MERKRNASQVHACVRHLPRPLAADRREEKRSSGNPNTEKSNAAFDPERHRHGVSKRQQKQATRKISSAGSDTGIRLALFLIPENKMTKIDFSCQPFNLVTDLFITT